MSRNLVLLALLFTVVACKGGDVDGDGSPNASDCAPNDPAVGEHATEDPDNDIDDDCDGIVDDGDSGTVEETDEPCETQTWYADEDRDGFGDEGEAVDDCEAPIGYVANADDCDDGNGSANPDAVEVCNGGDDDCDGIEDNDPENEWYVDSDGDGFGSGAAISVACDENDSRLVANADDCDDLDATVNPDAIESCNDTDDDCNGQIDDGAVDPETFAMDADGDGHGDIGAPVSACDQPSNAVSLAEADDCDDAVATTYPGADELCNDADDNCSGIVDEPTAVDADPIFMDVDGDGFGDAEVEATSCEPLAGWSSNADDCDDADAAVSPDGVELCNGMDDDCDGATDESDADDVATWYADVDGDGHGDLNDTFIACVAPTGYVASNDDCDDTVAAVNPEADEVCNGVDDNCDGSIDPNDAVDAKLWFADTDGDGFGDLPFGVACNQPTGFVENDEDCDDTANSTHPGADELCDGVDQDCDGATDEDAVDMTVFYADTDGDAFGDAASPTSACDLPIGYVLNADDCDDEFGAVNPSAIETCNDVDDDCDGIIDLIAVDRPTWSHDSDGDGYGDVDDRIVSCDQPSGYIVDATDCEDDVAAVNPGADEVCNGVDDDCDTVIDTDAIDRDIWFKDADGDGVGKTSDFQVTCMAPSGYVAKPEDCDDASAVRFPGNAEACDGIDNDCVGGVPANESDADADGARVCAGDCKDDNAGVKPSAVETCDGVDQDCDGTVDDGVPTSTSYADTDGDGFGNASSSTIACAAPAGNVSDKTDCDDTKAAVNPGAVELCNGTDDDCDGQKDEATAGDAKTFFADQDGDTHGDPSAPLIACAAPVAYVVSNDDCDPIDASVFPGAPETCDGDDEDCDMLVDESAIDAKTWYPDADRDTYGVSAGSVVSCADPSGTFAFASKAGDCKDDNVTVNPGMPEVCGDGIDNNCDTLAPACSAAPDTGDTGVVDTDTGIVIVDGDTDNDGLSDAFEGTLGTDPNNADTDGDGVKDGQELVDGTNPLVADGPPDTDTGTPIDTDTGIVVVDPDTDDDGLTDAFEAVLGTDPNNADTDGDGVTDGVELALGTNPLVAEPIDTGDTGVVDTDTGVPVDTDVVVGNGANDLWWSPTDTQGKPTGLFCGYMTTQFDGVWQTSDVVVQHITGSTGSEKVVNLSMKITINGDQDQDSVLDSACLDVNVPPFSNLFRRTDGGLVTEVSVRFISSLQSDGVTPINPSDTTTWVVGDTTSCATDPNPYCRLVFLAPRFWAGHMTITRGDNGVGTITP